MRLREILAALGSARYAVKRGFADWLTWPFAKHPMGVAILCEEQALVRGPSRVGRPASWALEFAASVPAGDTQIDDAVLDTFHADAEEALRALAAARDTAGNPIVYRVDLEGAEAVEFCDADARVQGLRVRFELEY